MIRGVPCRGARAFVLTLACLLMPIGLDAQTLAKPSVDAEAAGSRPLPSPAFAMPADGPVDALWRDYLERGALEDVTRVYDVSVALAGGDGEIDVARCAATAAALDDAIARVPVSLALWDAAYRCADAAGDSALATKRLRSFEALARHALASAALGDVARPIRIVSLDDAYALIRSTGDEILYGYYAPLLSNRGLLFNVALYDAEAKRERDWMFDFIDTVVQLARDEPQARYPIFRKAAIRGILDQGGDAPGPAAEAREVLLAATQSGFPAILASLRRAASAGNVGAMYSFANLCFQTRDAACAAQAVDLLLPPAEQRHAQALAMLAVANYEGLGVKRDRDAALKLVDLADERLGNGDGTVLMATLLTASGRSLDGTLLVRLQRLARSGSTLAGIVYAMDRKAAARKLTAETLGWLERGAGRGFEFAQFLYGSELQRRGDVAQAKIWFERASTTSPGAAATLAVLRETEAGEDDSTARSWRTRAAMNGHVPSMVMLARHYLTSESARDYDAAKGWAISAMNAGSTDGALLAARALRAEPGDDAQEAARTAIRFYRAVLHDKEDSIEAARELAGMLLDRSGPQPDPEEARALLTKNAKRNDATSQRDLGAAILHERISGTPSEAEQWLERAIDNGDFTAMMILGEAKFRGRRVPRDVDGGRKLLQRAAELQPGIAANDVAWIHCTLPDDRFDLSAARKAAKALAAIGPPRWGRTDTLAACAAAEGDFARAVSLQKDAIAARREANAESVDPATDGVLLRLASYERRERWIVND